MPGALRSPELARRAKERLPNLAVLFTSGYTENAIVHGGRLDEGIELLSKPYSREALARKIRYVLRNQQQRNVAQSAERPKERRDPGDGSFPARPLRILLVEDDAMIRFSTAEMLTNLGHAVEEAGDAGEALATLEQGGFDVIVTDLALPGMSGEELAAARRRAPPGPAGGLCDGVRALRARPRPRRRGRRGGAAEALRPEEHRRGAESRDDGGRIAPAGVVNRAAPRSLEDEGEPGSPPPLTASRIR